MRTIPLTLRPNAVVDTGRVSYDGAIMLFPRKPGHWDLESGKWVPSLRECIVARPGRVFSSEDFKAGELFAHGQSCIWLLGYSDLASALLRDLDPHSDLASKVLGVTYEEFIAHKKELKFKYARQAAKPVVFGRPASMGSGKIVLTQRAQGPNTPCPGGPSEWLDDATGKMVRGYTGLRFCILMNGSETCGVSKNGRPGKTTRWGKRNAQQIPPTCVECLECSDRICKIWLKQWRENQPYFDLVEMLVNEGQVITPEMIARWPWIGEWFDEYDQLPPGSVMQHFSGRVRGGLEYSALANGFFQALLADITKRALCRIARECYDHTVRIPERAYENSKVSAFAGGPSPLLGSRPIGFFHDEIFLEHDEQTGHESATRVSEILVEEMSYVCPDVAPAVQAEPTLMRRWNKSAEPVRDAAGRLQVWEPDMRRTA